MPLDACRSWKRIVLPSRFAGQSSKAEFCDKRLVFTFGDTYIGYPVNRFGILAATKMTDFDPQQEHGLVVEEATPKLKRPPQYQVLLLNDDYTPMEFVVEVLERVFGMDRTLATRVMLEVHTKGRGICGVFTYEIAETKVAQVTSFARQQQHPLLCTMEEV